MLHSRLSPCPRFPPSGRNSPFPLSSSSCFSSTWVARSGHAGKEEEEEEKEEGMWESPDFPSPIPSLRHTSLLPFFSSNKWGIYIFGWRAPPPPPPEFGGEAWMSAKKLHPSSHSCIYPVHVGEILAAPLSLTPSDPAWLAWGGHALVAHSPIPSPPIQQGCCPPRRRDRRESSSSPSFTSFS